jgi:hypothetical protein
LREETIMRSLRRLSAVLVISLPAILLLSSAGARAQSVTVPSFPPPPVASAPAFVIHVSPLFATRSEPTQQPQPLKTYRLPPLSAETMHNLTKTPGAQKLALLAGNEGCYALRTYGFTTPRDAASAPHLSSYKTCTPASQTHLKELVRAPQAAK